MHKNKDGSSNINPHIIGINTGGNRQAADTANYPAHMGGHNVNNRDDMSQNSYDDFGEIIN